MKLLLQLVVTLLFLNSSLSHAEKFTKGIPSVIEGEAGFETIIGYPDLKTSHSDLNKDDLAEVEGYFVVDQKSITNSIKASEAVAPLQNVARKDGPFNPRHYISYQSTCYECSRVLVNTEGWYKTLSLNEENAKGPNAFYNSINFTIPRTYQEKPNKFKNKNAVSGSDASSTRPYYWPYVPRIDMSNRTGVYILAILMMNIMLTFIFNWHFGKTPLEEDISLSQRVESSYQIYIPMAQTYEVEIDFSKINKSAEVIENTFGTIIQPKTKSSQIRLLWEIEKDGEIVQSHTTSTNEPSAWSSKSITMRFGRFKVPAGSYNFTLKVLDSPEEYNDFETTLIILYNLNNAHTWQTYYMFFGMLFNMFVAPIIGGFILLRFLVG